MIAGIASECDRRREEGDGGKEGRNEGWASVSGRTEDRPAPYEWMNGRKEMEEKDKLEERQGGTVFQRIVIKSEEKNLKECRARGKEGSVR